MFKWTKKAKAVRDRANLEARRLGHKYIGTEHILLGLIESGENSATKLLEEFDIKLVEIHKKIEKLVVREPANAVNIGKLPLTPLGKRVFEYAMEEARDLGCNNCGPEHILLGIMRENEGIAAQILFDLGLKINKTRKKIRDLL